jgi:site-specific DNA-cytosine methylase
MAPTVTIIIIKVRLIMSAIQSITMNEPSTIFKRNSLSIKIKSLLKSVEAVTKNLKLQLISKNSQKRKLVISTNWLDMFSFKEGSLITEKVIGHKQGLCIKLAGIGEVGIKKVYGRNYQNRSRETQMDIRHQKKLNNAFGDAREVHITFSQGELKIIPTFDHESSMVHEGLNIKLKNEDGVYSGIMESLDVIKNKAFSRITLSSDDEFESSQEYTLFCMQLRRMGYKLSVDESGVFCAELSKVMPVHQYYLNPQVNIPEKSSHIDFNFEAPLSTFVACTAGVDISSIEESGFEAVSILETRPVEKRDIKRTKCKKTGHITETTNDKTESCAINAAINANGAKVIFNEDIYNFNVKRISHLLRRHNFLHASLQCSDFSGLKNKADRLKAIESLDSTRDMIFPLLDIIKETRVPTLLVENVKNFASSVECKLFEVRLKKLGYTITKSVLSAEQFNGYTKRTRCFIFATLLDSPFSFPEPIARTKHAWRDIIAPNLHMLRDVTHTKTVAKAVSSGRLRVVDIGDEMTPTFTKSQSRQVKDSVYVRIEDRYYMPSNLMIKKLMGIESYNTNLFNEEMITEFIGQSIEGTMHGHINESIKSHILDYVKKF